MESDSAQQYPRDADRRDGLHFELRKEKSFRRLLYAILPRSEVTKKLWDYIKKNKLQDEKKKTLINADDALKAVFGGKKQVTMFEMTKHVSGHMK